MLKIKTNKNNCILSYHDLSAVILSGGSSYDDEITVYAKNHCLLSNDTVVFNRKDGDTISFWAEKPVNTVIDKNTFTIDNFPPYLLLPSGYELVNIRNPFVEGISYNTYLRLYFDEGREHIYTTNKDDIKISGGYISVSGETEYVYSGKIKLCPDDYLLYDDVYLVKYGATQISNINNLVITATHTDGTVFNLKTCVIGVNAYGNDNRLSIYIPYDGDDNYEFIERVVEEEEFYSNIMFTGPDVRFLYGENPMEFGLNLKPGTLVEKVRGDIEVDFGIGDNFAVDLLHEKQIKDHVEKVANSSINKIIDYERQQFTPMYYIKPKTSTKTDNIDDNLKPIDKIQFNLNFREKQMSEIYDENGDVYGIDLGTWETYDGGYWNNYKLSSDFKRLERVYQNKNVYGDLLGFLGFTDDDVRFQKDALKNSFLRLSFYDSPDRRTQKLLYYSTMYLDTNKLLANYIKDLNAWRNIKYNCDWKPEYGQLTLSVFKDELRTSPENLPTFPLTAEVFCTDKYDNTSSSDGFYLYLFDKLISGNTVTPIYMKAEFNNAKYGKTIPLIYPVDNSNTRIPPTSEKFPKDYVKSANTNNGRTAWIDVNSLLKDTYIQVYIKYNYNTNNFVWYVPSAEIDGTTMKFELFEPRLFGYDSQSYYTNEGNVTDYGTNTGNPVWWNETDYRYDGDGWKNLEEDGTWKTEEEWAEESDVCCLMTTATTLQGESLINGTKLLNKNVLPKIERIYIDGMCIKSDLYYNSTTKNYFSDRYQLPDVGIRHYNSEILWTPSVTTECWDEDTETWISLGGKETIIHSVNYYFKNIVTGNSNELIDELYLGIKNRKTNKRTTKTIECDESTVNKIKNYINSGDLSNGCILPKGIFSKINSLRCVKFVKNGINEKYFTVAGNGAFNNCQNLIRVEVNKGALEVIGKHCFAGCRSLKKASISDVIAILREGFQGCYTLRCVDILSTNEAKLRYIGCGSFGYTKIKEFTIPKTLIRIANSAFRRCYQLADIVFKDGITRNETLTIGKRAFRENTIYNYNLRNYMPGSKTYSYIGGNPLVLKTFIEKPELFKAMFYNSNLERHVTLSFSELKIRDALKVFSHFNDSNYVDYLKKHSSSARNFEYWYWNMWL